MLKDDRMISVLSGVVVMLAFGVLAQRFDLEGRLFGNDGSAAVLRDDKVFTDVDDLVRIDVLANDDGLPDDADTTLAVSSPPDCGQVFVQDGAFQYLGDISCVGRRKFTYTAGDGLGVSGEVTVVVRRTAPPTRGSTRPPAAEPAPASGPRVVTADGVEPVAGTGAVEAAAAPEHAPRSPDAGVIATAPAPMTPPSAAAAPAEVPEALRRGDGAAPAGRALPESGPAEPGSAGTGAAAPEAPARVPIPLIGADRAAAADLSPDYGIGEPPSAGFGAPDDLPADLPAILGAATGREPDAAPSHPPPGAAGPIAALGPAGDAPLRPAGVTAFGEAEPDAMRLDPAAPVVPGPVAEPAADTRFGALPDLVLPAGAVSPDDPDGLPVSAPGHPASLAGFAHMALAEPAWAGTGLDIAAGSGAPPRVSSGVPEALAAQAAPAPDTAITLPDRDTAPLVGATEPRPDAPARPAVIALASATDEWAGIAGRLFAPVDRSDRAAAAPVLAGGLAPVTIPGHEASPLAAATEPQPAEPVRLAAVVLAIDAPARAPGTLPGALAAPHGVPALGDAVAAPGMTVLPGHEASPLAAATEPQPAEPVRLAALAPGDAAAPASVHGAGAGPLAGTAAPPGLPPAPGDPGAPAAAPHPERVFESAALTPSGEICAGAPHFSALAHPAALTEIRIDAPCVGGSVVRIAYEGLVLGVLLDRDGTGSVQVPGLHPTSQARLNFADGTSFPIELRFRDIERVQRLIVAWEAPVEFGLHAFEDGARELDAPGHVGPSRPRSYQAVRIGGGGFLTVVPAVGPGTSQLAAYTLWQSRRGPSGVVRMELDFVSRREAAGSAACGAGPDASPEYLLLVSVGGRVEPMTRNRIAALDCAAVSSQDNRFVAGALPNLVISAR